MKQAGEVGHVNITVQRRSPPLAPSSGINGTNFSYGQNNKNPLASIESVNTIAKAKSSTPYDVSDAEILLCRRECTTVLIY